MIAYFATARIAQHRCRMYGYSRTTERNLIRQAIRKQRKEACDTETALEVVREPNAPACGPEAA